MTRWHATKAALKKCEKWSATQVPAFQLHSPQILSIKLPPNGTLFTTRHEGKTQSRANSKLETQKKRKTSKDFRLNLQLHSAFSSHKQNQQPGRNKRGRKRNYSFTGKQRPGLHEVSPPIADAHGKKKGARIDAIARKQHTTKHGQEEKPRLSTLRYTLSCNLRFRATNNNQQPDRTREERKRHYSFTEVPPRFADAFLKKNWHSN